MYKVAIILRILERWIRMENNDNYKSFNYIFNAIQETIAQRVGKSEITNFGKLLEIARNKNDKVILAYYDKLDFYRELRNLLTHKSISKDEVVALPSDTLLKQMEEVAQKIRYPKKVRDLFTKTVVSFNYYESLKEVLIEVNKCGYSQFPVFKDGKIEGIISENGITNFLAKSIEEDIISISETKIGNIIGMDEMKNSFQIIKESKSIFDIETIFSKEIRKGNSNFLLLIAKNGEIKSPKDIKGIITPWDLPVLIENK